MNKCPCGSELNYDACCKKLHDFTEVPLTAESCMRARYSAFVKLELDFLKKTYNPDKLNEYDDEATKNWASESDWQGLEIVRCEAGQEKDENGVVEFKAKYTIKGVAHAHHEISQFKKIDGNWYFIDGDVQNSSVKREGPKVGRNDPCPCGSGKKYKKCCL